MRSREIVSPLIMLAQVGESDRFLGEPFACQKQLLNGLTVILVKPVDEIGGCRRSDLSLPRLWDTHAEQRVVQASRGPDWRKPFSRSQDRGAGGHAEPVLVNVAEVADFGDQMTEPGDRKHRGFEPSPGSPSDQADTVIVISAQDSQERIERVAVLNDKQDVTATGGLGVQPGSDPAAAQKFEVEPSGAE